MSYGNQYQTLLRAKIKAAIEQAKASTVFTHQGVKGAVLEILVGGIFKPLLPSDVGVGTGQILDAYNSPLSGQTDIILYDKSILPPALVDERVGIFPIESVLYTIEVKTTLNSTELASAHEFAKRLSKFGYLPGLRDEHGNQSNHPVEKARSVVFALNTDLSGSRLNEAQRYKNIYKDEPAHIRAICVAGREYWYDNGESWIGMQSIDEYDETLAFLGGVTNTYKHVGKSRHSPLLGNYVIPNGMTLTSIESRKSTKIEVKCERCGKKELFKPDVGKVDVVINGSINALVPCPSCGGKLSSAVGAYKFVKGELESPD